MSDIIGCCEDDDVYEAYDKYQFLFISPSTFLSITLVHTPLSFPVSIYLCVVLPFMVFLSIRGDSV